MTQQKNFYISFLLASVLGMSAQAFAAPNPYWNLPAPPTSLPSGCTSAASGNLQQYTSAYGAYESWAAKAQAADAAYVDPCAGKEPPSNGMDMGDSYESTFCSKPGPDSVTGLNCYTSSQWNAIENAYTKCLNANRPPAPVATASTVLSLKQNVLKALNALIPSCPAMGLTYPMRGGPKPLSSTTVAAASPAPSASPTTTATATATVTSDASDSKACAQLKQLKAQQGKDQAEQNEAFLESDQQAVTGATSLCAVSQAAAVNAVQQAPSESNQVTLASVSGNSKLPAFSRTARSSVAR